MKRTVKEQLEPAARDVPHVLEGTENGEVTLGVPTVMDSLPSLYSVSVRFTGTESRLYEPKAIEEADNRAIAPVAVPLTETL